MQMSSFHVLNIQSTLSLVAFALLARWHLAPRLAALPREEALVPLLWVQVFRYAPLALYAPGQVDPRIPGDVAAAVGYGDLISGVLALIAVAALELRARVAVPLVWIFSAVGVADLLFATYKAVGAHMYTFSMGFSWYILNFYVPALVVSHVMIVQRLIRGPATESGVDLGLRRS
jgi:hypothetical protein